MYLYQRNPYKFDKKYCPRTRQNNSIQKIVTSRFEDVNRYKVEIAQQKQNINNEVGVERDYCAFSLSKIKKCKRNDFQLGRLVEKRQVTCFEQQNKKERQQEKEQIKNQKTRNRIKLAPLKHSINKSHGVYGSMGESPAQLIDELRPKFIV